MIKIGITDSKEITMVLDVLKKQFGHYRHDRKLKLVEDVKNNPDKYIDDIAWHTYANHIKAQSDAVVELSNRSKQPNFFGAEIIDETAKHQMYAAMKLPISVDGAVMPDGHAGYGLPIGGVLATDNAVIPYGVGVDIGCRMCLSVFRDDVKVLETKRDQLHSVLLKNTRFGLKERFERPSESKVLEDPLFGEIPLLRKLHGKAHEQLGSSGGGNHFVEFGVVTIPQDSPDLNLKAGKYMGLLSHSGSRGLGANIAQYYTRLARKSSPLADRYKHLSWLDLNTQEGQEYWLAMNLAGDYASACHHDIHRRIAKAFKTQAIATVENHHNFAWKEKLSDGREVIVHRKGATPAGAGVLGVIPGSMTQNGYIVKGLGNSESLQSASHGAGRLMSRSEAKRNFTRSKMNEELINSNVILTGGGVDESPMVYKDIGAVMAHQTDLVEILGSFTPRIVRMASD